MFITYEYPYIDTTYNILIPPPNALIIIEKHIGTINPNT